MPSPITHALAAAERGTVQGLYPLLRRGSPDDDSAIRRQLRGVSHCYRHGSHFCICHVQRVLVHHVVHTFYIQQGPTVVAGLAQDGLFAAGTSQHHTAGTDAERFAQHKRSLTQQHRSAQSRQLVGLLPAHQVDGLLNGCGIVLTRRLHIGCHLGRWYAGFRAMIATIGIIHRQLLGYRWKNA